MFKEYYYFDALNFNAFFWNFLNIAIWLTKSIYTNSYIYYNRKPYFIQQKYCKMAAWQVMGGCA